MEEELYSGAAFPSLSKAHAYLLYFNYERKNRHRGYRPWEAIKAKTPGQNLSEDVLNLPPIVLDYYQPDHPNGPFCDRKPGYHVSSPDRKRVFSLTGNGQRS